MDVFMNFALEIMMKKLNEKKVVLTIESDSKLSENERNEQLLSLALKKYIELFGNGKNNTSQLINLVGTLNKIKKDLHQNEIVTKVDESDSSDSDSDSNTRRNNNRELDAKSRPRYDMKNSNNSKSDSDDDKEFVENILLPQGMSLGDIQRYIQKVSKTLKPPQPSKENILKSIIAKRNNIVLCKNELDNPILQKGIGNNALSYCERTVQIVFTQYSEGYIRRYSTGNDNLTDFINGQGISSNVPIPLKDEIFNSFKSIICSKDETKDETSIFKNNECPICLELYKKDENVVFLPCDHTAHKNCITGWFKTNRLCPNCRFDCRKEKSKDDKKTNAK